MPFEIIWSVGGFVFSDLVNEFSKNKKSALELLEPINSDSRDSKKSFFIKLPDKPKNKRINKDTAENKNGSINDDVDEEGYAFISQQQIDETNEIKEKYSKNIFEEKWCKFKSRFYSVDFFSIYYTLSVLEQKEFDRSIIRYIGRIIEKLYSSKNCDPSTEVYIDTIAYGLHLLSYHNINLLSWKQIEDVFNYISLKSESNIHDINKNDTIQKRIEKIYTWFSGNCTVNKWDSIKFNSSKRLWCSLRDYIKSLRFNKDFSAALRKILSSEIYEDFKNKVLDDNKGCEYIELPGDVWNENTIFRKCFARQDESQLKGKLGKVLRENWERSEKEWYPEQFDITFDIAPRMCEKNNVIPEMHREIYHHPSPENAIQACFRRQHALACYAKSIRYKQRSHPRGHPEPLYSKKSESLSWHIHLLFRH